MCVYKYTVGESCLSHTCTPARTQNAHALSAVWAGFSVLVFPINTATRTLSSPPLARSLSPVLTHSQSRTHPPHTRTTSSLSGLRPVTFSTQAPARRLRAPPATRVPDHPAHINTHTQTHTSDCNIDLLSFGAR